jgi:hypothetical protein
MLGSVADIVTTFDLDYSTSTLNLKVKRLKFNFIIICQQTLFIGLPLLRSFLIRVLNLITLRRGFQDRLLSSRYDTTTPSEG